jgi:hypothetical protein
VQWTCFFFMYVCTSATCVLSALTD